MTTEVCRCCGAAVTLEGQHSHLLLGSVLNGQAHAATAGHEIVLELGE